VTTIVPLEPRRADDWLAFFDGPAFADNPEWSRCYCRCFLFGGGGFERWDAACANEGENRGVMAERVRAGTVDGLLAYREGRVVGWLHFGPTDRFHTPIDILRPVEDGVASIVCFVVAPEARRSGVARALLREACAELGRRGFTAVDGRPAVSAEGDMHEFMGPLGLYLSEGFVLAETGEKRHRVRRVLPPRG